MKLTRTVQLELAERAAGAKTFSAVISTEAPVSRRDWRHGAYREVLSHAPGAVNLERAPLPLLESHNAGALPVGVVDNLRVTGGKLRGEVRFGAGDRAQQIARDVADGVVRNLSVGYRIDAQTEAVDGETKTLTATRWTPHEVSAVAVGADAGAGFNRSHPMPEPHEQNTTEPQNQSREWAPPEDRIRQLADAGDHQAAERARCAEITRMTQAMQVPGVARELIDAGASIEQARMRVMDAMHERFIATAPQARMSVYGAPSPSSDDYIATRGARDPQRTAWLGRVEPGIDTGADFRAAAVDAVLLRAGIALKDPHPAARDVDASVRGIARICVSRAGATVSGGDDALLQRAFTTSDFPGILGDVMHKALRRGWEDEPASHRQWVRTVPVVDFRDQHRPILGSAPALDQVLEGGEYTEGSMDDDSTSYKVAKYGKIVAITWEALRNDNIGAFVRIQPSMGQAARRKEADIVYALFADNAGAGPAMQDGNNLFDSANHGNVATAGAVDDTSLGEARALLRKQTALGGGYMSLVPKYVIVPAEQETALDKLLTLVTRRVLTVDAAQGEWIGNLEKVVEPRLDNTAFYLAADAGQIDTVELGLLEENQGGPFMQEEIGFKTDGYKWKVRHTFGAKFLDWRGVVKIPIA